MAARRRQRRAASGSDLPAAERERAGQVAAPAAANPEARRGVLLAAARLLAYPDRALCELLPEIEAYLRQPPASDAAALLAGVAQRLRQLESAEREARYVATFDFDEAAALYLTAHELGDSRRRGRAMVELRALLRAVGFEQTTTELPDYLPLLLEFLAHVPPEAAAETEAEPAAESAAEPAAEPAAESPVEALERRLAAVCERIAAHLAADNLYRDVFVALCRVLPPPAEANPERRFTERERADTGEMPYPLRYD